MLLLLILILLIIYALYRYFKTIKPQVHVNPNSPLFEIAGKMRSLKKGYKPTPWLIEGNSQTIYGMRFRKKHLNYRREIFTYSDGGQCALDFYDPINNDDIQSVPMLLIIHTLGGGTREPCSNNLAEVARKKGWRAFIFNNRGCSGVPFTSRKFYNSLDITDIQEVIKYIKEKYNPPYLFVTGFSLGGYIALEYCTRDSDGVDAFAVVSHTYNGNAANEQLKKPLQRKLYLPIMMEKCTHILSKNKFVNYPEALKAKTLDEFDRLYTCKEYDYVPEQKEYYDMLRIYQKIQNLRKPTLILGADNDPFTKKEYQPTKEAEESCNCIFVHVSEGGHVSFPTGMSGNQSYIEDVVLDFFDLFITKNAFL